MIILKWILGKQSMRVCIFDVIISLWN